MREVAHAPSRTTVWLSFLLSLVGLAISIYLTIAHYAGTSVLACSDKGIVNCATVTTSAQSHFLGMPVSVLGLAFYAGMTILMSPPVWRIPSWWLSALRGLGAVTGLAMILWLIAAEILIIDHICLWCTGVHVVTFLLAIVLSRVLPSQLARDDSATA